MSELIKLKKIEDILSTSIENFERTKPIPSDAVSASIFDTLHQIDDVDPLIADLMHQLMDHETCSKCDDLPFTEIEHSEATMEWLKSMHVLVAKRLFHGFQVLVDAHPTDH